MLQLMHGSTISSGKTSNKDNRDRTFNIKLLNNELPVLRNLNLRNPEIYKSDKCIFCKKNKSLIYLKNLMKLKWAERCKLFLKWEKNESIVTKDKKGKKYKIEKRLINEEYKRIKGNLVLSTTPPLQHRKKLPLSLTSVQFQFGSSLGFYQQLDDIRYSILVILLERKNLVSSNFQFQSGSSLGFYQRLDDIQYSILVILLERKNLAKFGLISSSSPISARVSSNFQFQSGSSLGFYQRLDDIQYSILVILLERKNLAKSGHCSFNIQFQYDNPRGYCYHVRSSLGFYQRLTIFDARYWLFRLKEKNLVNNKRLVKSFYQRLDDIRYSILVILLERKNLAKSGHCSFNIQFQYDNPRGYCYRVSSNIQFQSSSSLGFYQQLDDIRYLILVIPLERKKSW
ncbi:hypothetical protein Glove_17g67 [Diversispora epigaea]|uniref:Uncharacterized protein n=1 Tax=Diversispora epigaea TaxID=1348612 RepID=A0A397JVF4_9GLOM|nr:hypothetical protein Glove_17g67 [Diversispora epigaea]